MEGSRLQSILLCIFSVVLRKMMRALGVFDPPKFQTVDLLSKSPYLYMSSPMTAVSLWFRVPVR